MKTENSCYLCSSAASIEDVPHEGGERVDVLCEGDCPRYIISQSAIQEIIGNPGRQQEALGRIKEISEFGKFPIIRFDAIEKAFIYTSKEDEV